MLKAGIFFVLTVYTSMVSALPPCVCTRNLKPVCGSDGVTYSNECMLNCQNSKTPGITLAKYGNCDSDPVLPLCICNNDYTPVCGSDGVTYPNKCSFDCEKRSVGNLEIVSSGPCPEKPKVKRQISPDDCVCTLEYKPVCGSDGVTYPNRCAFDCRSRSVGNIEVVSSGLCPEKPKPNPSDCICTYEYKPVCGSDGVTYPNRCAFNCKNRSLSNLEIVSSGPCEKNPQAASPICICTLEYKPVCGSDGVTYPNRCAFDCQSRTAKNLKIVSDGACQSNLRKKREAIKVAKIPICQCTKEGNPVCGSDGKTYGNPCTLNCMKAVFEDLHIEHSGRCADDEVVNQLPKRNSSACTCSRDLQPVCASNGVTYTNACLMKCAGEDLAVVRDAPCEV